MTYNLLTSIFLYQVLVACDNGSLDHLKLAQSAEEEETDKRYHFFDRVATYTEHRDFIAGIAKSPSDSNLVTCSADGSIVAWDLRVSERESVYFGQNSFF